MFIQARYNALKRNHDKLEMEMTQVRLWQAETLEDHLDDDEVDGKLYTCTDIGSKHCFYIPVNQGTNIIKLFSHPAFEKNKTRTIH